MNPIDHERWLYQKTKTDAINVWRAWNEGNKIFTQYGQLGGALQTTVGTECIATNEGRSNYRSPEDQAKFEVESMYRDQLRLKYSETLEAAQNIVKIQSMLAHDAHKVQLKFPVDIQRKYDGLRMMRIFKNGKQILLSRGNKVYSVKHIEEELLKLFPEDVMTDGELYIHGVPLQKINSLVKKPQTESQKIEYHIYDIPCDKSWKERKDILNSIKSSEHIKIVETFTTNNMDDLIAYHDKFVQEGYEGAIIRIRDSKGYEFGKRSNFLLKYKAFEDKEFLIVGIECGTGKMSECPIFVCKNDINDKLFNVVPIGTMEDRKEMFDNKNIGKWLTVKFINRTLDGIPKFAVGKVLRDSKDLPKKEE